MRIIPSSSSSQLDWTVISRQYSKYVYLSRLPNHPVIYSKSNGFEPEHSLFDDPTSNPNGFTNKINDGLALRNFTDGNPLRDYDNK